MNKFNDKIKELNKNIPENSLRRNSLYYEYVCYVNNIYSFYFTGNIEEVRLFIDRANRFLEKRKLNIDFEIEYIKLSMEFISEIEIELKG